MLRRGSWGFSTKNRFSKEGDDEVDCVRRSSNVLIELVAVTTWKRHASALRATNIAPSEEDPLNNEAWSSSTRLETICISAVIRLDGVKRSARSLPNTS